MSTRYLLMVLLFGWCSQLTAQEVIGVVKNAAILPAVAPDTNDVKKMD